MTAPFDVPFLFSIASLVLPQDENSPVFLASPPSLSLYFSGGRSLYFCTAGVFIRSEFLGVDQRSVLFHFVGRLLMTDTRVLRKWLSV